MCSDTSRHPICTQELKCINTFDSIIKEVDHDRESPRKNATQQFYLQGTRSGSISEHIGWGGE